MKKILIFTYLQRHLKKMIPIIKEFEKDKNIDLTVLLLTSEEKQIAEENKIQYKMLDEFTEKKRDGDFDLGWGLEPLINAIDRIKPDLFLAIEVNYILRNAVRYCKSNAISTLIVQHGAPNKYSLHAFAPFEGDCFAAWGDFTKEFLTANGVDPKKIVVTGGPVFDKMHLIVPDKENIGKILKINPNKRWVVFTTQGTGAGNRPSEKEIFYGVSEVTKASLSHPEAQLIFQVHPSHPIESIEKIVKTVKNTDAIITKYKDTEKLIAASDAVITFFSTTAMDTILLQKPLLLINLSEDKDFFPFVKMNAAIGAYKKEEVGKTFEQLMNKDYKIKHTKIDLKRAADYVNFRNDGKALNRVIQLCYQLIDKNGSNKNIYRS